MRDANWETREVEIHFSNTYNVYSLLLKAVDMGRVEGGKYLKAFCEGGAFGLSPSQLEKVDWEWIIEANEE